MIKKCEEGRGKPPDIVVADKNQLIHETSKDLQPRGSRRNAKPIACCRLCTNLRKNNGCTLTADRPKNAGALTKDAARPS
jgi:hypothetical protein